MHSLISNNHEGKRYFVRDYCNGGICRYAPYPEIKSSLTNRQQKKCLDRLTIDLPASPKKVEATLVDTLDLDTKYHLTGRKRGIQKAFTFKEYMELSLYDKKSGYYTTRPGLGTDFRTKPMRYSPHYGMWVCDLLFNLWVKLLNEKSIGINEPFNIIEAGAGTGILAHDILKHAKDSGVKSDSLRNKFYNNLFYVIIEISPELIARQKKTLVAMKKKCGIIKGDIRHLESELTHHLSGKGFFLSNELPDAFSMHKIRRLSSGELQASIVYPVLNKPLINKELYLYADRLARNFVFLNKENQPDGCILSKTLFNSYCNLVSGTNIYKNISWKEVWVDYDEIKELRDFADDHQDFLSNLTVNQGYAINTDLRKFQDTTSKLISTGYKITIDYQKNNDTILKTKGHFRCYPGGIPHDFSNPPGICDITADINASTLAVEGLRAGWNPIFFGNEKILLGISNSKSVQQLAHANMNFHVLIEKKNLVDNTTILPMISLPVTYKELFTEHHNTLPKLFRNVLQSDPYCICMVAHNLYAGYLRLQNPEKRTTGIKKRKLLREIYSMITPLHHDLKKAIKLVFKRLIGKESVWSIIQDYNNLEDVEWARLAYLFDQTKTSDNSDYLAFLLIRQLFQIHFYFEKKRTS